MIEDNEYEYEEDQGHGSDVETMLDAIRQKNLSQAKGHFENLINDKVNDSLEAEKIRIANVTYNGADENEEVPEAEVEVEVEEDESGEWEDITAEIEDSLEQ